MVSHEKGPTGFCALPAGPQGGISKKGGQVLRRRVAARRPPPASRSSEPPAKGTSAPVEGGAITAAPVPSAGMALEVAAVAEVPRTPLSGVGEAMAVGVPAAVGAGDAGSTGAGAALSVLVVVVVPLVVFDFVVVLEWLVDVECAVRVDVTVVPEVGTGVAVAAATDSAVEVPESIAPAGP